MKLWHLFDTETAHLRVRIVCQGSLSYMGPEIVRKATAAYPRDARTCHSGTHQLATSTTSLFPRNWLTPRFEL